MLHQINEGRGNGIIPKCQKVIVSGMIHKYKEGRQEGGGSLQGNIGRFLHSDAATQQRITVGRYVVSKDNQEVSLK